MGAQLLERRGRALELTPLGHLYKKRLARLFAQVQILVDEAQASHCEPTGLLRIGSLTTLGVYLLAPQIARFQNCHTSVEVELHYSLAHEQLERLHAGELDLVFGVGPVPDHDLHIALVGSARPVLISRIGDELSSGEPLCPGGPA